MRIIKSMEEKYLVPTLDLVEAAFTDWADAQEGKLVRSVVEEIRGMDTYIPELELISSKEAVNFYKKYGFEERPCDWDGPGMFKMIR